MEESKLLTTKEVAKYLKINEKKVYQLVKERAIPCTRVAGKWLFPKDLIDEWINESVQRRRDIFIAGSNDPFLSFVINLYTKRFFPDSLVYYASIGSAKGLEALSQHKATIAATHLFDPESEDYNLPYLPKYLGSSEIIVINLTYREQGFILPKGNPLNIKDFSDLAAKKVRFINRNFGSGTRLLLDYHLSQRGIKPDEIRGYEKEVNTHLEVGLSILNKEADVGIGIHYIANTLNLDFVAIGWERFDLVLRREDYYLSSIKNFLSLLDPLDISLYAKQFPGYDFKDTGKILFRN